MKVLPYTQMAERAARDLTTTRRRLGRIEQLLRLQVIILLKIVETSEPTLTKMAESVLDQLAQEGRHDGE